MKNLIKDFLSDLFNDAVVYALPLVAALFAFSISVVALAADSGAL